MSSSLLNQESLKSKKVKIKKNRKVEDDINKRKIKYFRVFSACLKIYWNILLLCGIITFMFYLLKEKLWPKNNFCFRWSFFIIKQNAINQKFKKFTSKLQLAYYVTLAWSTSLYVMIQFNHSQLCCSFISSWNQVKNTTNHSGMIKPRLECCVHWWLQLQLCQIQKCKPYDFVKADQNPTKEQHFTNNST